MGDSAKGVSKELRAAVAYLRWICLHPNVLTDEVVEENYQQSMALHHAVSDFINQALGVLRQPPR
ncbi:hypothetical protein CCS38_09830 [Streptomyces purpurogeneiscleroticus]|nr:hypothetical protein [Streptomyces purpurogeneiscleroticus]